MKQYLVELLGSFFLVLVITLTGDAMAIGLMLTAMMYMGSHISGGHYNPAVSFAIWLRDGYMMGSLLGYFIAQTIGALLTGLFIYAASGNFLILRLPAGISSYLGVVPEFLAAFAFCSAMLMLLTTDRLRSCIGLSPLLVGLALTASVFIPGVLLNPALGMSSLIFSLITGDIPTVMNNLVVHIAGPLLGAAFAAYWFRYLNKADLQASATQNQPF